MARKPSRTQQRSDEIAELISEAGEKLVGLTINWFELNDKQGLSHARRMLNSNEVTLMLSAYLGEGGIGHISLNLLRTSIPMPRPFFDIKTPMLPWTLDSPSHPLDAERLASDDSPAWRLWPHRRTR
jgi:hypothetical protein